MATKIIEGKTTVLIRDDNGNFLPQNKGTVIKWERSIVAVRLSDGTIGTFNKCDILVK